MFAGPCVPFFLSKDIRSPLRILQVGIDYLATAPCEDQVDLDAWQFSWDVSRLESLFQPFASGRLAVAMVAVLGTMLLPAIIKWASRNKG